MNKERRERISTVFDEICDVRSRLEELRSVIGDIQDEEQEALDCIPENLQGSERYEKGEEAVENLDDAGLTLDDVLVSIEEALDSLDSAME